MRACSWLAAFDEQLRFGFSLLPKRRPGPLSLVLPALVRSFAGAVNLQAATRNMIRGSTVQALPQNRTGLASRTVACTQIVTHVGLPSGSRIFRTIGKALEHPWNKTLSLWSDFQQLQGVKAIESSGVMERAMGIESAGYPAIWKQRSFAVRPGLLRY